MPYDPAIHHRKTIRLGAYDYRWPGGYFVTIVVEGRQCLFGDISSGAMGLSPLGQIAADCWLEIPEHFPQVTLDSWVVMPNHVHGVIVISSTHSVGTRHAVSLRTHDKYSCANREDFQNPVSGSLSAILRSYKSAVTKQVNKWRRTLGAKLWQGRFFEHVIRNEADLNRIREYINLNPENWDNDDLNPTTTGAR